MCCDVKHTQTYKDPKPKAPLEYPLALKLQSPTNNQEWEHAMKLAVTQLAILKLVQWVSQRRIVQEHVCMGPYAAL